MTATALDGYTGVGLEINIEFYIRILCGVYTEDSGGWKQRVVLKKRNRSLYIHQTVMSGSNSELIRVQTKIKTSTTSADSNHNE